MGNATEPKLRLCSGCGKPISERRLLALPDAELCLSCQEQADVKPHDAKWIGDALAAPEPIW